MYRMKGEATELNDFKKRIVLLLKSMNPELVRMWLRPRFWADFGVLVLQLAAFIGIVVLAIVYLESHR